MPSDGNDRGMIHAFGYWLLSDSDLGLIIFAFALLGVAIGTQIGRAWEAHKLQV